MSQHNELFLLASRTKLFPICAQVIYLCSQYNETKLCIKYIYLPMALMQKKKEVLRRNLTFKWSNKWLSPFPLFDKFECNIWLHPKHPMHLMHPIFSTSFSKVQKALTRNRTPRPGILDVNQKFNGTIPLGCLFTTEPRPKVN